jgi:ABC-2 type transport system ATP-binding protein
VTSPPVPGPGPDDARARLAGAVGDIVAAGAARPDAGGARGPVAGDARAAAVVVRELRRHFAGGAVTALGGVSFEVGRGELFGIVGPDGAGKTTLLRILAGVLPPSAGDALVDGISVARAPERVKPSLAYMPQRFGLYDDLTVRENIDFYADLYRVPRAERPARLERLYRFSNLGEFESRLAGQLSGGMKQKLSLSCCLVHHPRVLLLDEPTFGVDPISRRDLWLILHQMVAEGVTVVLSTSYMDEAERCDRVALLHEGAILALDTPARLQASLPGTLLTIRVERPRAARDALRGHPGVRRAALFGDSVHVLLEGGTDAQEPGRVLAAAGLRALAVERVDASLEDVFIDLVAGGGTHA